MEISDRAMQQLKDGGLKIQLEAVVLGVRTIRVDGTDLAKINALGPLAAQWDTTLCASPYRVFELDAEMSVFQALCELPEPKRMKFLADLKPVNSNGGYVAHLLQILDQGLGAGEHAR